MMTTEEFNDKPTGSNDGRDQWTDVAAKLKAAEDYANEITPNGSRRIDNITGLLSDKQADHIKTQIDLAFKAGWHAALARKGGDA